MRKIIIMFLSLVVFISTMMSVVGCGGGIKIDTSKLLYFNGYGR